MNGSMTLSGVERLPDGVSQYLCWGLFLSLFQTWFEFWRTKSCFQVLYIAPFLYHLYKFLVIEFIVDFNKCLCLTYFC